MATKKQLQQACKESEERAYELSRENENLRLEIERLNGLIVRGKETESEYWHSYQSEQNKARYYAKGLRQLRYVMALDTVQQATHRDRNELMRQWCTIVTFWLSVAQPDPDKLEDIPF